MFEIKLLRFPRARMRVRFLYTFVDICQPPSSRKYFIPAFTSLVIAFKLFFSLSEKQIIAAKVGNNG